jgi:hypothetical protein
MFAGRSMAGRAAERGVHFANVVGSVVAAVHIGAYSAQTSLYGSTGRAIIRPHFRHTRAETSATGSPNQRNSARADSPAWSSRSANLRILAKRSRKALAGNRSTFSRSFFIERLRD